MTEENHEWKKNSIDIHHKNSIQVLNQHGINCKFWLCHSKYILEIDDKLIVVLGTTFRNRKSLGEKKHTNKTKVKPNANRGCPIELTTHILSQRMRAIGHFCSIINRVTSTNGEIIYKTLYWTLEWPRGCFSMFQHLKSRQPLGSLWLVTCLLDKNTSHLYTIRDLVLTVAQPIICSKITKNMGSTWISHRSDAKVLCYLGFFCN